MLQSKFHCFIAAVFAVSRIGGGAYAGVAPVVSSDVVKINITADKPRGDGIQVINVTLSISPSFHILANPVGNEDLVASQTSVRVHVAGRPVGAKITYPQGKLVDEGNGVTFRIYEGKTILKVSLTRAKENSSPVEIIVSVQASNEQRNLRPSRLTAIVP